MQVSFYLIRRGDGGVVDVANETPYVVANDCEAAQEVADKLPEVAGGYVVEFVSLDTELAEVDTYFIIEGPHNYTPSDETRVKSLCKVCGCAFEEHDEAHPRAV